MDNIDPNWVWYASAILGIVAAGGFTILRRQTERANAKPGDEAQVPATEAVA
jgi:hypothetical protein